MMRLTAASLAGAVFALAVIGAIWLVRGHSGRPTGAASQAAHARPPRAYVAPDGRSFDQLITAHVLPNPVQTPGVINPRVTPQTLKTTICSDGWTARVRPSTTYTDAIKADETPPDHRSSDYELDHLVSIEDGGDPSDPANLWMQAYGDVYGARVKDVLETKLARLVCAGKLTLDQAHKALSPNWLIGFQTYVGPLPTGD